MRRLLIALVGTLAAWLGLVAPSAASAEAATSTAAVHSYDDHHTSAQHDIVAMERGPPSAHHSNALGAVDRWSRGGAARPGGAAPATPPRTAPP